MVEWKKAACKDVDPEIFFPITEEGPSEASIKEAKRICSGCDIARACLKWAISTGEPGGVWGGKTEGERRKAGGRPDGKMLTHKQIEEELDLVRAQQDALEELMRRQDQNQSLQKQG